VRHDREVRLSWTTATEVQNDYFVLERSADGQRFEFLQTVEGRNTLSVSDYEWTDLLPLPGLNYYRLSQVDFDGRISNLGMRAVQVERSSDGISVYPNPANEATIVVATDLPAAFSGTLELTDMNGKILSEQSLQLESGRNYTEQSVDQLPTGVYWLRLREAAGVRVLKFYKN
jgi:hypothetical protein